MKAKMNLRSKIQTYVIGASAVIFAATVSFISINSRQQAATDAKQIIRLQAWEAARQLQTKLESDFAIIRTMRTSFQSWKMLGSALRDSVVLKTQRLLIEDNPSHISVATSWELEYIDPTYTKHYGRLLWGFYRENGQIKTLKGLKNLQGDDTSSVYYKLKTSKSDYLGDPEPYSYTGKKEDEVLSANISIPLISNGKFIGLAGADIDLSSFSDIVGSLKPFKTAKGLLISNNLKFVVNPNLKAVGNPIAETNPELVAFAKNIIGGEEFQSEFTDSSGRKQFLAFVPVKVKGIHTPWSVGLEVPMDEIMAKPNHLLYLSIAVGIIGLLIMLILVIRISASITNPVKQITKNLLLMAQGKIKEVVIPQLNTGDELEAMNKALEQSVADLSLKSEFAKQIGTGDLEATIELPSTEDELGKSMLEMQQSLKKADEDAKSRASEEHERQWASEGFAKFGELLRKNSNNLQTLCQVLVKELTRYMNFNQGGIFLLNDNDSNHPILELTAAFAFDRVKFLKKEIQWGEGLVGACAFEGETIYLTEVPQDYIKITSGLGDANPNSVILVPLKDDNGSVLGVIEMASFTTIVPYQQEFLEQLGRSIASTIGSVRINQQTALLLQQTRQQAEEMMAQEEEMRQNIEELHATQEEMTRKEHEIAWTMESINNLVAVIELDSTGTVTHINEKAATLLGYTKPELVGKNYSVLYNEKEFTKALGSESFWSTMRNNKVFEANVRIISQHGSTVICKSASSPQHDSTGNLVKIMQMLFPQA
ncbi:MAG TPA: GAF domain-containing protein [Williamwhitmania sp.]|nr:GAF domain-containing protein [Williamwhitmania sp.]